LAVCPSWDFLVARIDEFYSFIQIENSKSEANTAARSEPKILDVTASRDGSASLSARLTYDFPFLSASEQQHGNLTFCWLFGLAKRLNVVAVCRAFSHPPKALLAEICYLPVNSKKPKPQNLRFESRRRI
jgi:hypothetical protein